MAHVLLSLLTRMNAQWVFTTAMLMLDVLIVTSKSAVQALPANVCVGTRGMALSAKNARQASKHFLINQMNVSAWPVKKCTQTELVKQTLASDLTNALAWAQNASPSCWEAKEFQPPSANVTSQTDGSDQSTWPCTR